MTTISAKRWVLRFDGTTLNAKVFDRTQHDDSHIEQFCLHVAEFNAWKRRVFDANRKRNLLPHGPLPASHPPSNWHGIWSMASEINVLVREQQVPKICPVLCPQGDISYTFAPVPGVQVITFQSIRRQRAAKTRQLREMTASDVTRSVVQKRVERSGCDWNSDDVWNGAFGC
jgi:hypothetical protein